MNAWWVVLGVVLAGCAAPADAPPVVHAAEPPAQESPARPTPTEDPEEPRQANETSAEPERPAEAPPEEAPEEAPGETSEGAHEALPTGPGTSVVVATFDTGTNPFHPCFRRPGWNAAEGLPGLPADAAEVRLSFEDTYQASLAASRDAINAIRPGKVHHFPGTNLLFYGAASEFVDDYPHGAQASSQIACEEFGFAPDAWVVVLNWYDHPSGNPDRAAWVAQQDWIDVVHFNIQDVPWPSGSDRSRTTVVVPDAGIFTVIAAGNGVMGYGANYPMELSSYHRHPDVLVLGSIDNHGYTYYSNLDPHVVADGSGTRAAEPYGHGETRFGGTSSASPRGTGYVAELLRQVREAVGHAGLRDGDVLVRAPVPPEGGPLADGALSVAELHEVVRKTATPDPHHSDHDGDASLLTIPHVNGVPMYAKMGYGEVSDQRLDEALAVLLGEAPMPDRPVADRHYAASEAVRTGYPL